MVLVLSLLSVPVFLAPPGLPEGDFLLPGTGQLDRLTDERPAQHLEVSDSLLCPKAPEYPVGCNSA